MDTQIKRESLVAQVVNVLQRDLANYARFKWLPGERILCERFQISRTTLRTVLAQLQRRGLIRAIPSKGYRVLQTKACHPPQHATHVIAFLQEESYDTSEMQLQMFTRNVEHILNAAGYQTIIEFMQRGHGQSNKKQVAGIVAAHPTACWALSSTSLKTQHWFAHREIPAMVMGSCHPGICLPNMDIDCRAICRHALSFLWRQGHRRITFLTIRTRLGGDIQSELGFTEGWRQFSGNANNPSILHHDGSVEDIGRVLQRALTGRLMPTALLVSHSLHALTAASYLMHHGYRLPGDMSLVCRDSDEFLIRFTPPITCYVADWHAVARRSARALIQLATAGRLPPRPRLIMARFNPGGTVASPAAITR